MASKKTAAARTGGLFGDAADPLFAGKSYRMKVLEEVARLREGLAAAGKAHFAHARETNKRIDELLRSLEHGPRKL